MPAFQFKTYFDTMLAKGVIDEKSTKRWLTRILFSTGYPLVEAVNWSCLGLDHLIFPEFKQVSVERPVFIVGNPRSGTTYLHRLMAQNDGPFITPLTWQLALPSASQQRVARAVGRLDDKLGGPLTRLQKGFEENYLSAADRVHRMRLHEPEEDDGFLIHAFASGFLTLLFPREELRNNSKFDDLPEDTRLELMAFYKGCVQRTLLGDGSGRRWLSKNPLFTAKIDSLRETFPDAHFIYLVRHPAETIASVHSMITSIWASQGMATEKGETAERPGMLNWVEYLYRHGIDALDRTPSENITWVQYEELTSDPVSAVSRIHKDIGVEMTPEFLAILEADKIKNASRKSQHSYQLEDYGLTHEKIEALVPWIYDRFGYERLSQRD